MAVAWGAAVDGEGVGGVMVGSEVGANVGEPLGAYVSPSLVGAMVGATVASVGAMVGSEVGSVVGSEVGASAGTEVGSEVGDGVAGGVSVGAEVAQHVGQSLSLLPVEAIPVLPLAQQHGLYSLDTSFPSASSTLTVGGVQLPDNRLGFFPSVVLTSPRILWCMDDAAKVLSFGTRAVISSISASPGRATTGLLGLPNV
jgi:hypothetical protein